MSPSDAFAIRCDHSVRRRAAWRALAWTLAGGAAILVIWAFIVAIPVMVWLCKDGVAPW
jgi:ferric-dicitrate binding protein FerR (iron transport regulator)